MALNILGAGLSGLSAAINLAEGGKDVLVHERQKAVGMAGSPNFQATRHTIAGFRNYLKKLGLKADFEYRECSKATIITRSRILDVTVPKPITFVCRGGEKSLEHGLYRTALEKGVSFNFGSTVPKDNAEIIATGPSSADIVAYGAVYENEDFEKDRFLMMYDDRFSPTGYYFYIVPHLNGTIEAINVVMRQDAPLLKKLYYNAIKREGIREIAGNRREVHKIGGIGSLKLPTSAFENGKYLVGEAAGFQDPFRGFGMKFALESGKFAADSILYGKDYDLEWKKHFLRQMKLDFARRFVMSLFGDRFADFALRKIKPRDTLDFYEVTPKGVLADVAVETAYLLERLKKKTTGHW